jgi:N utilization substance protein B
MVQGIVDHREDIDGLLRATSQSWPLERMPAVDRAVLRLATWEMLHNPEVPAAVAISEALELVNEFSTEASAGFVHGVLSSISGQSEAP